ncbi:hypothetical protein BCR32DRAFT_285728 [Anaeromyces robustus]|uniref:CBM10 domain-containing protein n=1 Tax=Anaeromyces robustus TaxID=1754192 RepID=A0A1Y1WGC9_9FUNG|nr:hypothetical protein BCR32DRAFT_285728 [Anaeromyces robustus]|eukprot:ORX72569.1 hypothetical protein BCR32DRAFT_285728 [Anaeromyces robustus]
MDIPDISFEVIYNGFLDLFFIDNNFYYPKQYKYTTCPDADARAIQATYFAYLWAKEDGINLPYSIILRATRLGDYLRYSHYDKYFKKIGDCFNYKLCTPGSGIMGDWTWRRGSSYIHSGYQNPLVAWIFSTQSAFKLKSSTGNKDWSVSLDRQLEFMRWLQTPEGCIAGGATNSWEGQYNTPPQNITNFYGMYYDWQPVYHNPSSNNWIGMQARSIERVCSLYYLSGNQKAELICQTWVEWIKKNIQIHDYEIIHATKLTWEGNPDDWDSSSFYKSGINTSLHGTVFEMGFDLGSMASIVKSLLWVSMKDNDQEGLDLAIQIMDIIENYKDDLGYAVEEFHDNYSKFANPVYFPNDWKGRNPQGAYLKRGACFLDIRPKYKEDPDWYQVEYYLNGYENPPVFTYHRFWVQAEIMIANGLLSIYKVKSSNHNDHSNNNNNNNNNNSGSGITRTNCSEAIIQEGYECCPIGCKIYYTDSSGDWGIYNNDWCGCGSYVEPYCNQEAILYGYPCCSECSTVYYQDKNGEWGIENGDWCGMPYKCKNK